MSSVLLGAGGDLMHGPAGRVALAEAIRNPSPKELFRVDGTRVKTRLVPIVLLVLSAVLAVGVHTFASPCASHEEGSFMSCHWAGEAIFGIAVALVAINLISLFAPSAKARAAFSASSAVLAVLLFAVPGGLINLCMMDTMQCQTVMKPFTLLLAALLGIVGILGAIKLRNEPEVA